MKYKSVLSSLLLLGLALSLCACGAPAPATVAPPAAAPAVTIAEPQPASETVPGYISTELETPDWIDGLGGCEMLGDVMYFSARPKSGGRAAASYDTLTGEWRRYDLSLEGLSSPAVTSFSAAGHSLWFLFETGSDGISGYFLLRLDLLDGTQTCRPLDFWREGSPYLCSFIALDDSRVLIGDDASTYLLNAEAEQLPAPSFSVLGEGRHARVDGVLYLSTTEGFCPLDPDTLSLGEPVPGMDGPFIYGGNRGHLLVTEQNNSLYQISVDTLERVKLFDWLDVALSYSNLYSFLCGQQGFENSAGDIYHLSNKLTKVSPGEVPLKKPLTLARLGPADGFFPSYRDNPSTGTRALMDAVLRFNNSDPEYRVEFLPLLYENDAERDRLLISLASGSGFDLLDTSFLPSGAADAGLLVDLLPYIDADPSLSRDDFLPGLLSAMTKSGGLYEYSNKVTLLSVLTRPDCAPDGTWTVEDVEKLIARYPDARLPSGQEGLISQFSLAATAEFLDWEGGVSRFDSPAFVSWLSLLQTLCSKNSEPGPEPFLFYITSNLAGDSGSRSHHLLQGDYVIAGFPDAAGTGSYFTHETSGRRTTLGIMASGQNRDGAWRFLRTFMQGETEPLLFSGIPVFRESFEQALDTTVRRQQTEDPELGFTSEDADCLRDVVYHTDKLVCTDDAVLTTLRSALTAFLSGKTDAPETARQIHSRMSIYMAEQCG